MEQKPWQWMIDEIAEDINFWTNHGLDKKNPNGFSKMQKTLQKAKDRQVRDMKKFGMS